MCFVQKNLNQLWIGVYYIVEACLGQTDTLLKYHTTLSKLSKPKLRVAPPWQCALAAMTTTLEVKWRWMVMVTTAWNDSMPSTANASINQPLLLQQWQPEKVNINQCDDMTREWNQQWQWKTHVWWRHVASMRVSGWQMIGDCDLSGCCSWSVLCVLYEYCSR